MVFTDGIAVLAFMGLCICAVPFGKVIIWQVIDPLARWANGYFGYPKPKTTYHESRFNVNGFPRSDRD